ncbi:MAG: SAM-dependent methyltransferase [Tepidiformaceae bacterium]
MDRWAYFAITHRDHVICNPTSSAKIDELIALLDLPQDARVLDIACGKGEVLVRVLEKYLASGVGVDLSPPFAEAARRLVASRLPAGKAEIIEADGADYEAEPGSFDLPMCLGASWVFGGYRQTLRALRAFVKPGGLVVSGEPFRYRPDQPPPPGESGSAFGSHAANAGAGAGEGLALLYTIVSSRDDWDRYEGLQWRAAERHAREHPGDPDAAEVLAKQREQRAQYLAEGRDSLGWAVYLFQRE